MFRLYRPITKGEFFVVFGDTAQGGIDSNFTQFLSKTRIDVPLVMQKSGVAAAATPYIHQALEWIYAQTGVEPVVALERNNGGSSEMERLRVLNRDNHYRLYQMVDINKPGERKPNILGWETNAATRPRLTGNLKVAIDSKLITVYDEETAKQLSKFINDKTGKPVAAANAHDDAVISLGGAWELYQTEEPLAKPDSYEPDYQPQTVDGFLFPSLEY